MMQVHGSPLLEHTIVWLRRFGVTDIIINLCHLPQAISDYFENGQKWNVRIVYSMESEPLGTAGGVKKAAWFLDEPFFLWYGDNFSTCNLASLFSKHRDSEAIATIALHHRDDPTQSGIVGLNSNGRITRFLEKPTSDQIFSHWVNAGIFVMQPEILTHIPDKGCPDFGKDIFPAMLADGSRLHGYTLSGEEELLWIDRPEDLERAQRAKP
jgi:NDP-sugar pyrophosphorylase family protein